MMLKFGRLPYWIALWIWNLCPSGSGGSLLLCNVSESCDACWGLEGFDSNVCLCNSQALPLLELGCLRAFVSLMLSLGTRSHDSVHD